MGRRFIIAMTHYICILLSLFALLSFASETNQSKKFSYWNCKYGSTFKPNSTFEANLKALLSYLASNSSTQDDGFYSTITGWATADSITGQFLCRGDVNSTTCHDCVTLGATEILQHCPNQTDAIIFYDYCMLRYTNLSFEFASVVASALAYNVATVAAADESRFNESVGELLSDVAEKAANSAPMSNQKFATGEVQFTSTEKVYGLEQCTPDLTSSECIECFQKAIQELWKCCEGVLGARILLTGCSMRYEIYPFFYATDDSPAPSSGKRSNGAQKIVAIVVPIIVSVMLFCLGCFLLRRKLRRSNKAILRENFGEESANLKSLQFNLVTIEVATNKFSHDNRIGKGGFGEVYKGVLLDGRQIAVKRLSKSSGQGAIEFKNEILLIAKLQHRNLVTLLGFCLEEQEKILIYEYVPNKSIDCFLFDFEKRKLLNWSEHLKIIRGIAQGLIYLHEHSRLKIIHRDLKPNNILLDNNMNPKISDFGMARMVAIDQDQGNTNRIVGTHGYMSPEYLMNGQFSEKSDIFSFGVIILEAISGKRNTTSYESHLLTDAWKQWNDGTPLKVLDPFLMESCSQTEAIRSVQIGLLCVQENPNDRPTMAEIVSYLTNLSNLSKELPFPRKPAFFMHNRENLTMAAESGFGLSSQTSSSNEMSKSELLPR